MQRRLRLRGNCAPALSIVQNGAVGRALPELFHHGVSLRQRLAVEALPPQALRRLPPVSVVAAADGAVVHFHFDSCRDDRRSSKAIWTCHMGKQAKGGSKTGKDKKKKTHGCGSTEGLSFRRGAGGLTRRASGS